MFKNNYLYRLYKTNKLWFSFFVLFIAGTIVTHKTGVEITPFFVWGMYSSKDSVKPVYEILEVTINNTEKLKLDQTFAEPYRMMIYTSFDKYNRYVKDNYTDSLQFYRAGETGLLRRTQHYFASKTANATENIHQYPTWLKRYIGKALNKNVERIDVDKVTFTYNEKGYATIISKTNLLHE
ncbi:hypothetical protein ACQ33O_08875 [Ferruginibacter sp. SUN002]|uniref:hypothetical protein n=1 Tax=Ferruginibacter sp. SUN002 TaxID=2937789 RepID=UPI003D35EDA5